MARPKTDPKVRAQALRRLRAGESARTVADDLGVSPTAVRNWLKHDAPAAPAVAPATPAFDIHEVHDAAPPPSGTADELDAEAYARAMRAAATDDAPPASGTPTDGPAAPGAGTRRKPSSTCSRALSVCACGWSSSAKAATGRRNLKTLAGSRRRNATGYW